MTQIQTINGPSSNFVTLDNFCRSTRIEQLPPQVIETTKLLILDLIGVLAAASKLDASKIARQYAVDHWAAGPAATAAKLLFDGRTCSLPGFAFAMATQLDNLDAHDGWQPSKGHAGAALFPALSAFAQEKSISGTEAIVAMAVGYEVAYRAAFALHETVPDYHTSGAWNALGCAAIGARLRKLSLEQHWHAQGIAEYHAPRSQMMREIANPTMLHDGSGWGAPTGVYAVLIASDGFTGAPAATLEFDDAQTVWQDLNQRWLTIEQYIKPYPVCRWVHAPIDAALLLRKKYQFTADQIDSVRIHTFAYSAELSGTVPNNSPKAQYSLAWPVAAAIVRGQCGVDEVMENSFSDPAIISLTKRTSAEVSDQYEQAYPVQRLASVTITLKSGEVLDSGTVEASGGPDPQPTADEVMNKYRQFAGTVMSEKRAHDIEQAVLDLDKTDSTFNDLLDLLIPALHSI